MEEPRREVAHWLLYGTAETPLDHLDRVIEHIVCRSCGYDLKGLQNGKQCPECGAPVGISLRGDLLSHSRPEWTAHVGKQVWIGGLLLLALPVVLGVSLVVAIVASGPVSGVLASLVLAGWCYVAFGAARPEPLQQQTLTREQLRVRGAVVGLSLVIVAGLFGGAPGPVVFFFGCVAFLVALNVHIRWLANLVLRVPLNDLCDTMRTRMWVVLVLGVVMLMLVLAQGSLGALFIGFFLVALVWIIFMLLLGYSCVQAGEILMLESRQAQKNWLNREALLDKEQRFRRPLTTVSPVGITICGQNQQSQEPSPESGVQQ